MDQRRTEKFFVIVSPGLESVCAQEMEALRLAPEEVEHGGINFTGKLADLYRANLWLRTASRVLVRFAEFRCRDFPGMFKQAVRLPWGSFLRRDSRVSFRVTCRSSRLMHTDRVAETLSDAVNRALARASNPLSHVEQLILVRIVDDLLTISIDSSGELLHRRGYRQMTTRAPMRETLAAGILMLVGWSGDEPLYDPMCGSGTFLMEASLIAGRRAPGLHRTFAFMCWPGWRPGLWQQLCAEAVQGQGLQTCLITGSDQDPEAVAATRENVKHLGMTDIVKVTQTALAQQPVHTGNGLVVCNPPYGLRLAAQEDLLEFHRQLGAHLRRAFPGWRLALLAREAILIEATGLPLQEIACLDNGGVRIGLYTCVLP